METSRSAAHRATSGYNGGYCGEWYETDSRQKFECAGSNSGCDNFSQSACLAAAQGLINTCCL